MKKLDRIFISFNKIVFGLVAIFYFLDLAGAQAAQVDTCAQYQSVTIGSYIVQTNYWNKGTCPATQCMSVDDATGNFSVTQGAFACAPNVATYPSIYYGCHYGSCSPGTVLPLLVSSLNCVSSNWSFTPAASGSWDAAYDIWFGTGTNTSAGYAGGAELMIWLDYMGNAPPAGVLISSNVMIDGASYTLYEGNIGWNYIAYLANSKVTSVSNLDLKGFFNDSISRGYIQTSWYLAAVEAGNELRTGGVPFSSGAFSVSVNGACGSPTVSPTLSATATSSFTATPTPTSTRTWTPSVTTTRTPSPTSTASPTASPTATATLTKTSTATLTASTTATLTATKTPSPTETFSRTATKTPVFTATPTPTAPITFTPSATGTATASMTATPTRTFSPTPTPSSTPTLTIAFTSTPSSTATATASLTLTITPAATFTPSFTPSHTVTFTPTVTPTLTSTLSNTPTASVSPTPTPPQVLSTPVLFPNPVRTSGPVSLVLPGYSGRATVTVQIVTTAFRLVNQKSFANQAGGSLISLPVTDKKGTPLANGLYYLIVQSPAGRLIEKLLVLR